MPQDPMMTLPHSTVCPITGVEETFQIGVSRNEGNLKFDLLTIDGWIPCPSELEVDLRSHPGIQESIREQLRLEVTPQEDPSPDF